MLRKATVKKKDKVVVLTGKDKGRTGVVLEVDLKKDRALVEGINMVKKHVRPNPQLGTQGGIEDREAPMHVSNLMVVCPECGKPSRISRKVLKDDRKVRVCKKCDGMIDK